jgi:hypothetical protein
MANSPILVSYQELAEMLVKANAIHEGYWGPFLRFGLNIANVNTEYPKGTPLGPIPTAMVPLLEIGIQRLTEPTPISVDAAKVNPKLKKGGRTSPTTARKKKRL